MWILTAYPVSKQNLKEIMKKNLKKITFSKVKEPHDMVLLNNAMLTLPIKTAQLYLEV